MFTSWHRHSMESTAHAQAHAHALAHAFACDTLDLYHEHSMNASRYTPAGCVHRFCYVQLAGICKSHEELSKAVDCCGTPPPQSKQGPSAEMSSSRQRFLTCRSAPAHRLLRGSSWRALFRSLLSNAPRAWRTTCLHLSTCLRWKVISGQKRLPRRRGTARASLRGCRRCGRKTAWAPQLPLSHPTGLAPCGCVAL